MGTDGHARATRLSLITAYSALPRAPAFVQSREPVTRIRKLEGRLVIEPSTAATAGGPRVVELVTALGSLLVSCA